MIKIESVDISSEALSRISDLIRKSEQLAHLVNEISSTSYRDFGNDAFMYDRKNGDDFFPDPACSSLKLQKFYTLGAGGLLFSAAHLAENAVAEKGTYHPYTPLSAGVVCRSVLEYACAASFILGESNMSDKVAKMYALVRKGFTDYSWNTSARSHQFYVNIVEWGKGKQLPNKKFIPSKVAKNIVSIDADPYGYLSEISHGNAVTLNASIISAQENLGFNEQFDYWALAIAYEAVFNLAALYTKIFPSTWEKNLNIHKKYVQVLRSSELINWGPSKPIPDHDNIFDA